MATIYNRPPNSWPSGDSLHQFLPLHASLFYIPRTRRYYCQPEFPIPTATLLPVLHLRTTTRRLTLILERDCVLVSTALFSLVGGLEICTAHGFDYHAQFAALASRTRWFEKTIFQIPTSPGNPRSRLWKSLKASTARAQRLNIARMTSRPGHWKKCTEFLLGTVTYK